MTQIVHANTNKIAVLGTGIMGAAIACNLQKNGFNVSAWSRTYEKAKNLEEFGVTVHKYVQDAVSDADIILTMLKDGDSVLKVINSALPNLSKGTIWIQSSTVGITANEQLETFAAENGLKYFDAPVQGTKGPAEQGKLIIIASGPLSDRNTVQSIFDAIGQRTVWVSEQSGVSSKLKLALNSWAFALTHGIAESLSIAKALGVDPSLVIDVVKGGPMDNMYFQLKSAAIISGNYDASFSLDNAVKDAELVIDAAKRAGVKVDGVEAGLERFKRAQQAGHGNKDMVATYFAK
ncbi:MULTISPECIES: NAD(P)-dependent oxidoreductase [Xenorhabdus]|uniref:NAD(P)-dependent oxidoreductase n=1 Tax=Xenorhabdus TaxID=626 RepID=UPI00064A7481|nr:MULTISPECIES: NAD(P)-dependent oxidoreductase [Xenorhabdus]KLU14851.1 3-hydroxyisobutyrate dehydrogenase [Xenorhabdus griffiniae]KOP32684.1 3-hydroxyisobutyrate dehydrogenase [Xenorhabdus sp. GDc328]